MTSIPPRISAIGLCLALALVNAPALAAEKLSLTAISSYFNALSTAQANFRQFNDDGTVSTGRLYLKRPGRMRFEYDPPEEALVVVGGGSVVVHDPKSDQIAESYPLRRTPLAIILARHVDLSRADMVVAHWLESERTILRAQDPDNADYGSIDLAFAPDPLRLLGWVVNDGGGGQTRVVLGALSLGADLSNGLFVTSDIGVGEDR